MTEVIGVRFKQVGKIYYFSPNGVQMPVGEKVIVETARGIECGEVAISNRQIKDEGIVKPLKTVIRVANKDDLRRIEENKVKISPQPIDQKPDVLHQDRPFQADRRDNRVQLRDVGGGDNRAVNVAAPLQQVPEVVDDARKPQHDIHPPEPGVQFNQQHPLAGRGGGDPEGDGQGRFADAAFPRGDRDDLCSSASHPRPPFHPRSRWA